MKNPRGQALIILLVALPLLLLVFGIVARVSGTSLAYDQVENHCDKKVLDSLEPMGHALERLGRLNPLSRTVISTRRGVDDLIATGIAVYYMPWLPALSRALKIAQRSISLSQRAIKAEGILKSTALLHTQPPWRFHGKIIETYNPNIPTFHLKDDEGYEGETGAPLEPTDDFQNRQTISGKITILTEKFLWDWADFSHRNFEGRLRAKNMTLFCKSKITMARLEDSWTVQLTKP